MLQASHAARAAPPGAVFEVCNAGTNSVNGWFRRDGDFCGRPQYKLVRLGCADSEPAGRPLDFYFPVGDTVCIRGEVTGAGWLLVGRIPVDRYGVR
jgi:hypothetical protein